METDTFPSLLWSADHDDRKVLSRAVRAGTLRRLAPGLYTGNTSDTLEAVVARHLLEIVGRELPGAVIVGRSAREGGRPVGGELTVDHRRARPLDLPGVVVRPRRGPGPLEHDMPLPHGLFLASPSRVMLESLRRPGSANLDRTEVERWLDKLCVDGSERQLNALRDLADRIAPALRATAAAAELRRLVAAVLGTGKVADAASAPLRARAAGEPYDSERIELFERFVEHLSGLSPRPSPEPVGPFEHRRQFLPFYEAYFSNFIEGTEFTLDEADEIVSSGRPAAARPEDSHDILGTYEIVSDPDRRARTADDADDFVELLGSWHRSVMGGRPEQRPGEFKRHANRAGSTVFVAPDRVIGTLRRAFDVAAQLLDPFARAAFFMFAVAEIHPFQDGNGRVARIAMNAELSAAAQNRIIIPTVYRLNYLSALKGCSNNKHFHALISVLDFAQRYTARIDFSSRSSAEADLRRTNALVDPYEADEIGVRLVLP